jgi:hypothetical protein
MAEFGMVNNPKGLNQYNKGPKSRPVNNPVQKAKIGADMANANYRASLFKNNKVVSTLASVPALTIGIGIASMQAMSKNKSFTPMSSNNTFAKRGERSFKTSVMENTNKVRHGLTEMVVGVDRKQAVSLYKAQDKISSAPLIIGKR